MPDINAITCLADVLGDFEEHHGVRLSTVGEDGDVLIAGHHDAEKVWAAWEEHTGYSANDRDYYDLEQRWAIFSEHTDACGDEPDEPCCCTEEFAWWVTSAREGHGDAVTWVRYSWEKQRARRKAAEDQTRARQARDA